MSVRRTRKSEKIHRQTDKETLTHTHKHTEACIHVRQKHNHAVTQRISVIHRLFEGHRKVTAKAETTIRSGCPVTQS